LKGCQFEASLGKQFGRFHLNHYKLGIVVHICHPSYSGSVNRRIAIQANLGIKARPYSKNN
jgi:hypothetical protein